MVSIIWRDTMFVYIFTAISSHNWQNFRTQATTLNNSLCCYDQDDVVFGQIQRLWIAFIRWKEIPVHNRCPRLFLHCHQEHGNRVFSSQRTLVRISFQICKRPSLQENPGPKTARYLFNFVIIETQVQFSKSIVVLHGLKEEFCKFVLVIV